MYKFHNFHYTTIRQEMQGKNQKSHGNQFSGIPLDKSTKICYNDFVLWGMIHKSYDRFSNGKAQPIRTGGSKADTAAFLLHY